MDSPRRIGLLLIVVGLVFFVARVGGGTAWPLFVIVPGAAMLAVALAGPRGNAGLAVPGSIVSAVGLILLVQEATGTFHTWSYAWGLVLASVGVGSFLQASIEENAQGQREGVRLTVLGLALFAAFGAFFELLIFGGAMQGLLGWILPLALIVGGVWMLRRGDRA